MMMGLSYGYGLYFFIAWLHTYLVRARGFSEKDLLFSTLPFSLRRVYEPRGRCDGRLSIETVWVESGTPYKRQ